MDDSYGGQDMSLTDSYKSRDLEPGVILTKFLILGHFQPRDSYKKNSYKKETVQVINSISSTWVQ